MQPMPPANTVVGLPLGSATKAMWESPGDRPIEEHAIT